MRFLLQNSHDFQQKSYVSIEYHFLIIAGACSNNHVVMRIHLLSPTDPMQPHDIDRASIGAGKKKSQADN